MKELYDKLLEKFSGNKIEFNEAPLLSFIIIPQEIHHDVFAWLKNQKGYNYLLSISGVEKPDCFEVVYHIGTLEKNEIVVLKVRVSKDNPEVPSLVDIFPSANLFERETFDMFGIIFRGHPNLKRLLLPEDWEGYPLRKDYKYPQEYHGIIHDRGGSIDRTLKK